MPKIPKIVFVKKTPKIVKIISKFVKIIPKIVKIIPKIVKNNSKNSKKIIPKIVKNFRKFSQIPYFPKMCINYFLIFII